MTKTLILLIVLLAVFLPHGASGISSLEDWNSLDELYTWLKNDNPVMDVSEGSNYDCEDVAFDARDRAYLSGKWLETEIFSRADCVKHKQFLGIDTAKMPANGGHYLNKAVIGNMVYYVNVINDKVWLAYYLD